MAYVQWIPFLLDQINRTTFIGRISVAHWNKWPEITIKKLNPLLQPQIYSQVDMRWPMIHQRIHQFLLI